MRKFKGQNLIEFSTVGLIILVVALAGVFFFGDSLASFFNDNNIAKTFTATRFEKKETANDYISGVTASISAGGKSLKITSPVESVLAQKMNDGTYVQTSGSAGKLNETVEVIEAYLAQLRELLDNAPGGTNTSEINDAIARYEQAINDYKNKNNTVVDGANDPILEIVNNLDITLDLSSRGTLATNLNKALADTLSGMPDGEFKTMVKVFTDSTLALGKSIDYSIDSRFANIINLHYYDNEFDNKKSELASQQNTLKTKQSELANLNISLAASTADLNSKSTQFNAAIAQYQADIDTLNGYIAQLLSTDPSLADNPDLIAAKNYLATFKSQVSSVSLGALPIETYLDLAKSKIADLKSKTPETITAAGPFVQNISGISKKDTGKEGHKSERTIINTKDGHTINFGYTISEKTKTTFDFCFIWCFGEKKTKIIETDDKLYDNDVSFARNDNELFASLAQLGSFINGKSNVLEIPSSDPNQKYNISLNNSILYTDMNSTEFGQTIEGYNPGNSSQTFNYYVLNKEAVNDSNHTTNPDKTNLIQITAVANRVYELINTKTIESTEICTGEECFYYPEPPSHYSKAVPIYGLGKVITGYEYTVPVYEPKVTYTFISSKGTINDSNYEAVKTNPTYTNLDNLEDQINSTIQTNKSNIANINSQAATIQNSINSTNNSISQLNNDISTTSSNIDSLNNYIEENSDEEIRTGKSLIYELNRMNTENLSAEEKQKIAKYINVYRNGSYSEILPDSYNGRKLCEAVHANIVGGECNLSY